VNFHFSGSFCPERNAKAINTLWEHGMPNPGEGDFMGFPDIASLSEHLGKNVEL
jgi:hypothetical protein